MFQRGGGFYPVKLGYLLFRTLNYCWKKPHKTYIGDVRCDAGRVFDYTSYFVTVGLSNTVQLRLLGNYSVILKLVESLLCCLDSGAFRNPPFHNFGSAWFGVFQYCLHAEKWISIYSGTKS